MALYDEITNQIDVKINSNGVINYPVKSANGRLVGIAAKSANGVGVPVTPINQFYYENDLDTTWLTAYSVPVNNSEYKGIELHINTNTSTNARSCKIYLQNEKGYLSINYIFVLLAGVDNQYITKWFSLQLKDDVLNQDNVFLMFTAQMTNESIPYGSAVGNTQVYTLDQFRKFLNTIMPFNNEYIYVATDRTGDSFIDIINFYNVKKYGGNIYMSFTWKLQDDTRHKFTLDTPSPGEWSASGLSCTPNIVTGLSYNGNMSPSGIDNTRITSALSNQYYEDITGMKFYIYIGEIYINEASYGGTQDIVRFTHKAYTAISFAEASESWSHPSAIYY